jgi:hypothetical protein
VTPELFHATNDNGESARARSAVSQLGLVERIRFRNIFYPEVQADFVARGGKVLPALWDGDRLIEGADAVIEALSRLR